MNAVYNALERKEKAMEWWKLFSGTFVLIFLAELGDKTQLAALAKTADAPDGSMAKWIVFIGASAALVSSTFIAVFLGHILKSVVPDERYIRLAAAILFLVFGASILFETYNSFRKPSGEIAATETMTQAGGEVGVMGGLALRAAMDFESVSRDRYDRVAAQSSPELAAVLLELSRDEESHLAHLRELTDEERGDAVWQKSDLVGSGVSGRGFVPSDDDRKTLLDLVGHEERSAAFYRDLAERTLIPSVRSVLTHLAEEEEGHIRRLREFI